MVKEKTSDLVIVGYAHKDFSLMEAPEGDFFFCHLPEEMIPIDNPASFKWKGALRVRITVTVREFI